MTGYLDPQTVHNPATGGIVPAVWGDIVRQNLQWLAERPHAVVTGSTTSLVDGTATTLEWPSADLDVGNCYRGSAPDRLTAPIDGIYTVAATLDISTGYTAFTGRVVLSVFRSTADSSDRIAGDQVNKATAAHPAGCQAFAELAMQAGDSILARGYQTLGLDLFPTATSLELALVGRYP